MDDTTGNLLGVLLGAVIAAVAGFIGLMLNKKTEHQQWLRNQKVEVYTALLRQAHASSNSLDNYKMRGEQTAKSLEGITDTTNARLLIIAPHSVRQEATLYLTTLNIAGQAQNIEDDELFRKWQASRSRSYSALESAIREDLGTYEKVRKTLRMRYWGVIYFFTDPFQKWYYRRYGVAWVTKHPTRTMRKHREQTGL